MCLRGPGGVRVSGISIRQPRISKIGGGRGASLYTVITRTAYRLTRCASYSAALRCDATTVLERSGAPRRPYHISSAGHATTDVVA